MLIHPSELPTPEELEAFFFEGMCGNGWSSPTPIIKPHPHLVGWKQTYNYKPFGDGHLLNLTDSWGDGQGLTEIKLRLDNVRPKVASWAGSEILLWVMHYKHGTIFPKDYLQFLTETLHKAYAARRFYGGRGESFSSSTAQIDYKNNLVDGSGFCKFSGTEVMERWSSTQGCYVVVGDTEYWGGCILD